MNKRLLTTVFIAVLIVIVLSWLNAIEVDILSLTSRRASIEASALSDDLPTRVRLENGDVVLFHHVSKAGGTTTQAIVNDIVQRKDCVHLHPLHDDDVLGYATDAVLNGSVSCIKGEMSRMELSDRLRDGVTERGNRVVRITNARDAATLMVSGWRMSAYLRTDRNSTWHSSLSLEEQLAQRLEISGGYPHNLMSLMWQRRSSTPTRSAWQVLRSEFVGYTVLEHYNASVCLLLWQFHHPAFEQCECDSVPPLGGSHGSRVQWHAPVNYSQSQAGTLLTMPKIDLYDLELHLAANRADSVLYSRLLILFLRRVRAVERFTGRKLLCTDGDDEEESIVEPLAYKTPLHIHRPSR